MIEHNHNHSESWRGEGLRVALGFVAFLLTFVPGPARLPAEILAAIALGWTPLSHVLHDLQHGKLSIDVLMIIAAGGAMILGETPEGLLLLFLFSLGHTLETYAEWRTEESLRESSERFPDTALRRAGEQWVEVPLQDVRLDDVLLLRAGEMVPVDGVVIEGKSALDESSLTGEAIPVSKGANDTLQSGTLNLSGQLIFRVTRTSEGSTAQKIAALVEAAREEHSKEQALSDFIGQRYTWVVLLLSAGAFSVWWYRGIPLAESFYATLALLVVASPCALVLSVPAAVLAAIARSASAGVIFRGGRAVDALGKVSQFCFDKTGTLTTGELSLDRIQTFPTGDVSEEESRRVLQLVASLEQGSTHPVGRALIRLATAQGLELYGAEHFVSHAGLGLEGVVRGVPVRVGSRKFLNLPADGHDGLEIAVDIEGKIYIFHLGDTVRGTAKSVIAKLKDLGIRSLILSGDRSQNVRRVGEELGITEVQGDLSPDAKLVTIRKLRAEFGQVAMVGDGMNDAPSLTGADVAIVMGGRGSGTALKEADVILVNDALGQLPFAVSLSRAGRRVIIQNLTISISVATCLIVFALFRNLPLSFGVFGHEGSTVLVLLNGLRLLRK